MLTSKLESWHDLVVQFGRNIERHVKNGKFEECIGTLELAIRRTAEAVHNQVIAEMLDSLNEKTREIMRRILILPGRALQGLEQQRALLAAMRQGDAALAEKLKRRNIRSSLESLECHQSFIL